MDPENEIDHRVDLYAVGVTLYQMVTGKLPQGNFKMPSELRPELDVRLDDVVKNAMEPDPELRYPSAAAVRADIDKIVSQPIAQIESGVDEADVPVTAPPPGLSLPAINLSLPAINIPLPRFPGRKKSRDKGEGGDRSAKRFYELGIFLLLVIVVVVFSLVFLKLNSATRIPKTENLCHQLASAIRMYSEEYGDHPSGTPVHIAEVLRGSNPGSIVFVKNPDLPSSGPFVDAWGNPVTYDFSTPGNPLVVSSGPDGVAGNSDDITN